MMTLFKHENKKILSNTFFVVVVFILVGVNIVLSVYESRQHDGNKVSYTPNEYNSLNELIRGMDNDKAYDTIAQLQYSLQKNVIDNEEGRIKEKKRLYEDVASEIYSCISYKEYVDLIVSDANKMIKSGLVGSSSNFVKRKLHDIKIDYSNLINTNISYGPSKGIEKYLSYKSGDFILIIVSLMIVVLFFLRENESGELNLYKTTYNGTKKLVIVKLINGMLIVVTVSVLFWVISYFVISHIYNFGDLNRQIQSIPMLKNSIMQLSVKEMLILFLGLKVVTHVTIFVVLFCVAIIVKKTNIFYFFAIVLFAFQICIYFCLSENSALNFFKYNNLYSYLNTYNFFGYIKINILNVPFDFKTLFIVIQILIIMSCVYACCSFCDRDYILSVTNKNFSIEKYIPKHSLFMNEVYKLFINGKFGLVIIVYFVFIVLSHKPIEKEFYVYEDSYMNAYLNLLEGPVSEDKIHFLENEQEKFDDLNVAFESGNVSEELYMRSMEAYDTFYELYYEITPYLVKNGGHYIKSNGYRLLTGDTISCDKDVKLAFLCIIVLLYPFAYLYGIEYQSGMKGIVSCCVHGKKQVFASKIILGIILGLIVYMFTYGLFYYDVFNKYGINNINSPANSMLHLESVPQSISILEYLIIVSVIRYVGIVLVMILMIFFSRFTKNIITSCVFGIGVVIMPLALYYVGIQGFKYFLFNPFLIGNVF